MDSDSSDSIIMIPKKREKYYYWSPNSNYDGPDIISNLPDSIIGHILSFLPIKYAVRTSVLSSRWKYMWTFITEVEIEDREPGSRRRINKTRFQNFMHRVLSHLNPSSIQSFSLSLSEIYLPSHIYRWISDILNLRVKELYIDSKKIPSNKTLNFPSCSLLESPFLEVLVLNMRDCHIRLPTFVPHSSLTVLKLSGIVFTCDLQNLTLNFPALRKYKIENCSWINVKGITLEMPMLEVLVIKHIYGTVPDDPVIKYCAPHLRVFSYMGNKPDTILLDLDLSTTCIASATIYTYLGKESKEEAAFLSCQLLKQFSNNVECLKFKKSEILEIPQDDLPAFGMLTHLKLGRVTGEIILNFLRNTPFLKTLIIKELLQFDEELSNPDNVPCCFMSDLQEVNFGRLDGENHELSFAKYVMENAQVLERVCFSTTWHLRHRRSKFNRVREKILSFKRSHKFAFIEFSSY